MPRAISMFPVVASTSVRDRRERKNALRRRRCTFAVNTIQTHVWSGVQLKAARWHVSTVNAHATTMRIA